VFIGRWAFRKRSTFSFEKRGFHSPRSQRRKVWDAFERCKTLEPGTNKAAQADTLLERAATGCGPKFVNFLKTEARQSNEIGNELQIRHHDHGAEALSQSAQIDGLFFRMFAFLHFVLSATGRVR
jgi:hypothetical protein